MPNYVRRIARILLATLAGVAIFSACIVNAAPTSLEVVTPPDAKAVITTTASGVQIYSCEFGDSHRLGWVFKSPLATLYDSGGQVVIHHAEGPSWKADDGSKIVGSVVSKAPSVTPDSIPQLLLKTKSVASSGALSEIRYVQRIDTVGGVAPTKDCTTEHQIGQSPYLAQYVFLK